MENGLRFLDNPSEITQNVDSKIGDTTSSAIGKIEKSDDIETTSEVIKFVDDILIKGIKKDVSDIHVEHFRNEPRIRYRKDGIMIVQKEFNKFLVKNYPAVVTRLKIMAETNISERRLPQDGAIQFCQKK